MFLFCVSFLTILDLLHSSFITQIYIYTNTSLVFMRLYCQACRMPINYWPNILFQNVAIVSLRWFLNFCNFLLQGLTCGTSSMLIFSPKFLLWINRLWQERRSLTTCSRPIRKQTSKQYIWWKSPRVKVLRPIWVLVFRNMIYS